MTTVFFKKIFNLTSKIYYYRSLFVVCTSVRLMVCGQIIIFFHVLMNLFLLPNHGDQRGMQLLYTYAVPCNMPADYLTYNI